MVCRLTQKKIIVITTIPKPTNATAVQRLNGTVCCFSFSTLHYKCNETALTTHAKSGRMAVSEVQEVALYRIKYLLGRALVLFYFDPLTELCI